MRSSKFLRLLATLAVTTAGLCGQPKPTVAEGPLSRDHPAASILSTPIDDTWLRKLQMVAITPKISGGSPCPVNRFPYMVSIRDRVTLNHICGGILLNRFWVLTAAHCLGLAGRNPVVVAGTNLLDHGGQGEELFVTQSILHPDFTGDPSGGNDIALIELLDPTTKVKTFANLPDENTKYGKGHQLLAIGWGTDGNQVQDSLDCSQALQVVSQDRCQKLWSASESEPSITASMVCAFSPVSDTCKGDSGGPLIDAQSPGGEFSEGRPGFDVIGGVTSFGPPCSSGDDQVPGVYTFLPPFRKWILEKMSSTSKGEGEDNQDATRNPPKAPNVAPFLTAAGDGDLDTVKNELAKGVDIESRNSRERTALHVATREGSVGVAVFLLDNGANIEAKDDQGWTPLHSAAFNGKVEVARLLLERGADLEAKADLGFTPLFAAAQEGQVEVVQLFIDAGADLEARDDAGATPLFQTAQNGHLGVLKLLLDNGADIEAKFLKFGNTPIHIASQNGHADVVEELIQRGADLEARSDAGSTPLYIAAQNGHLDVVKLLLDNGADIEAKIFIVEATPLNIAAQQGYADVVEELVRRGADVNAADDDDITSLHRAAQVSGGSAIITVLVNAGANIDAQNNFGSTPLHFAARNGHKRNVEKLVDLGADKSLKDQGGDTPADDVCTCVAVSDHCCCNVNVCNNMRMDLLELLE